MLEVGGSLAHFHLGRVSWKLWAFRRPASFPTLPIIQHRLSSEVAAGRKQLGAIVSREGKTLDKAEFKVDYNKSSGPQASAPLLPLLQMTAETKAAEPGVWTEFSSHNYTADVWGTATVSAEGSSFCSCAKNTPSSNMLITCLLPSNNIEGRLRKGHTMPTHMANSVMRPINLDGLSIKHRPPQRTELTRCLSFC